MNDATTSGARWALAVQCLLVVLALAAAGCSSSNDTTVTTDDGGSESGKDAASDANVVRLDAGREAATDAAPCLDTMTDPANCGSCGHACAVDQVCSSGVCGATCGQGLVKCASDGGVALCIGTQNDNANCGGCGLSCGAGLVCSAGACGLTCQLGLVKCNGTCVDPTTSRAFCGAIGLCQGPSAGAICVAGQVCNAGSCAVSCPGNEVNCNDVCVDPHTANQFCGASSTCQGVTAGVACAAGQVCSGGVCGLTCQSDLVNCDGKCVDPMTDRQFCGAITDCLAGNAGAICAAGQVCSGGACGLTCQSGLVDCNGTCVDPLTSRQLCGASGACVGATAGTSCPAGLVCGSGACAVSCPAGETNCNGTCADTTVSNQFCGATGNCTGGNAGVTCETGTVCSGGTCGLTCQAGLLDCGGACTDPLTSRAYCGAAAGCTGTQVGVACQAGEICTDGVCGLSCQLGEAPSNGHCCPIGQYFCASKCIDPTLDSQFCNISPTCTGGSQCGQGLVCSMGACAATCAPPLVLNGSSCVNPTSINTCGASAASMGTDCTVNGQICNTTGAVSACRCPTGESATNGHCCPTGQFFCNPTTCVGLGDDPMEFACAPGPAAPQCIDPTVDSRNCGMHSDCSLGVSCLNLHQVCSGSLCRATCAAPFVLNPAFTACVDPSANTTCGATNGVDGTDCLGINEVCKTVSGVSTCGCPAGDSPTSGHCCPTGQFFCSGICVDENSDPNNCGGCGAGAVNVCANANPANSAAVCIGGVCGVACKPGFLDCDGMPGDGCELDARSDINNCGGCAAACPVAPSNTTASCTSGVCGSACNAGFLSCDSNSVNGCEVACTPSNVTASQCNGVGCGYAACSSGFLDCDLDRTNGCEINGQTNFMHCGSCGNSCNGIFTSCVMGVCQ